LQPQRKLRKRLWIFCAIAAVLSAISFIPGILVIAGFLAGLPLVVLSLAPDALLAGIATLIADYISPPPTARKTVIAYAIVGLLIVLAAAAAWSNHLLDRQVQVFTKDDHDSIGTLPSTRDIAIQFVRQERARRRPAPYAQTFRNGVNVLPSSARGSSCESLCLHLLYENLADTVMVSSTPQYGADSDPAPDLDETGMRFHLELHRPCEKSAANPEATMGPLLRLFAHGQEDDFEKLVYNRIAAGQCILGEPARLSAASVILRLDPWLAPEHSIDNHPSAKNAHLFSLPPSSAARLTVYEVHDGVIEEKFRQTQVEAYPMLPVLLFGPVFTGEGGIGITEGLLRHRRVYSAYDLRDVLRAKLGLDITPLSR
jgi:hypothetical protein